MSEDEQGPTSGSDAIETQALNFSLEARDGVSEVMKKTDTVYAATAKSMEASSEKIAASMNDVETKTVKALGQVDTSVKQTSKVHEDGFKNVFKASEKYARNTVDQHKKIDKAVRDSGKTWKKEIGRASCRERV